MQEVKVVVKTFAGGGAQAGLARGFVVPGFERLTGFHRRKHMHQAWSVAALLQHLSHAIFFAEVSTLNVLDAQTGGPRREDRVIPDRIAQGFGEHLQIEATDIIPPQPAFYRPRMTDIGERAGDDDPIPTAQCADDLVGVAWSQQFDLGSLGGSRCRFRHASRFTTNSWFRRRRVRV